MPSVFPTYPKHKQIPSKRRKSPTRRLCCQPSSSSGPTPSKKTATVLSEHTYAYPSIEARLASTQRKLDASVKKREAQAAALKNIKRKVQRKDTQIKSLLQELKKQNLIRREEFDILEENMDEETRTIIEN